MATASMATATDYTTDDLICVCISRQVEDGEVLAQGIATPLVMAGYLLAKHTHAPNVHLALAMGNLLCQEGAPLGLTRLEERWLSQALFFWDFCQLGCELLPSLSPKEFFRPAQVDPAGNFNNIVIGEYTRPRLRLPGCGGIADVMSFHPRAYLYVPQHSPSVFVPRVDFVSGLGAPAPGPQLLISDLGVFDFACGRMRLRSYHPGASIAAIQARTGFPVEIAADVHETPPPSAEEVRLLHEVIDPLGIRALERMGRQQRWQRMRKIVTLEQGLATPN